jgi:hypothetical protein
VELNELKLLDRKDGLYFTFKVTAEDWMSFSSYSGRAVGCFTDTFYAPQNRPVFNYTLEQGFSTGVPRDIVIEKK